MTPDPSTVETATAAAAAPCRRCATCKNEESEEVRFGVDPYHCLACIAARIRDWRRRRKAQAAEEPNEPQELPAASAETLQVPVVRTSQLSLALEGYLAASGSSWLEVARQAGVDRAEVHRILMASGPTVERPVADALLRTIGAEPSSVPTLTGGGR